MARVRHDSRLPAFQMLLQLVLVCLAASAASAQQRPHPNAYQSGPPTPRPRNFHPPAPVHYVNIGTELAGDYKFGYDTGKGPLGQSFREETRLPDGTVRGAYGILDESGRQRIIRYTAGKDGFRAEGDGIGAAPQQAPAQQHYDNPAPAQQYYNNPAPAQQYYNPAPAQQTYRPQAPPQQYRPAPSASGQWDPRKDDPYYVDGPSFIDVERLSYNIGTAQQG